jgi:hypothetical protein
VKLTGQESLKAGQVPIDELPRVDSVKDVRTLRPCTGCQGLGNSDSMVEHGASWFHGRCFVQHVGKAALFALPKAQTDKLTLGDLGVDLMKQLIERRSAK